ncbi:MAG: tRNA (adenosine(37)-N6)-threonylcarbamoyltransferase complex ATPase subunit type 1 TsaE, partial [Microcystaceae cyanobacterium]
LKNQQATLDLGKQLGQKLPIGTILLLNGELGAGKTTLVQGIGLGLNINEPIVSPTFTLVNEYHEGRIPLYHLDLYRLETSDISGLYLEQYWDGLENPLGLVAIEWAERMQQKPLTYLEITLQYANSAREAIFTWHGEPVDKLLII